MARKKIKKFGRTDAQGKNKYDPFVMIRRDIYDSAAFKSLSPVAVRILLEIRRRYYGLNNGEISLSCREAATVCHVSTATASRALKTLRERGFIKPTTQGVFTLRLATTWTMTWERLKESSPTPILPTNEWRQWQGTKTEDSVSSETVNAKHEAGQEK